MSFEDENASRSAIVRLLRSEAPPRELRERLAAVFAPNGQGAAVRKVIVVKRGKGRPPRLTGSADDLIWTPHSEKEKRREISRALLSAAGLDSGLAQILVKLFAPDGPDAGPYKAVLSKRGKGRPEDRLHIAQMIVEVEAARHDQGKVTLEQAFADVAEKHGLTESQIKSLIERHPEIRKAISTVIRKQNG